MRWSHRLTAGVAMAALLSLGGCEGYNPLAYPQAVYRSDLTTEPIPVAPRAARLFPGEISGQAPPASFVRAPGAYKFTIPPTVSSFKKSNDQLRQYLLYYGVPAATQKPFLTITVSPTVVPVVKMDPNFRILSTRTFLLNGLPTREWSGYTAQNYPFTELIVSHRAGGDKLDALAIASGKRVRRIALAILKSIRWKPGRGVPASR